jgi:hypothetical protein
MVSTYKSTPRYQYFGETYSILRARGGDQYIPQYTEIYLQVHTERRGRVVNTSASYLGSPGFKSRPGDRIS